MNLTLTLTAEQLAELARQVAPLVQFEPGAPESPWLSVTAAAAYLSVSERTIERAIERGRLRSSTLGRRRLLHGDDLDTLARNNGGGGGKRQPPDPATEGVE